eukprot:2226645-Pleurochrysis_carterae.AAC.1
MERKRENGEKEREWRERRENGERERNGGECFASAHFVSGSWSGWVGRRGGGGALRRRNGAAVANAN